METTGALIWNVTWGGTGIDRGYATATGDSVYLAGDTKSFGAGEYDAFLAKYSEGPMPTPTPTPTLTPAPAAVPALTPIGLIALVGLLSVIVALSISMSIRKKRR